MNPSTIHFNPDGYEGMYNLATKSCLVTVKGYTTPHGKIMERGGPMNPGDAAVAKFSIPQWEYVPVPLCECDTRVRETFEDVLLDRRDLLNEPMFRNKPQDDAERKLFASAFNAGQKIRSKMSVLGVNKLVFALSQCAYAVIDCFARDAAGSFWVMACTTQANTMDMTKALSLAAYIAEAGGYLPSNASVRCGVWSIFHHEAQFKEYPNDRILARDLTIDHLTSTPF